LFVARITMVQVADKERRGGKRGESVEREERGRERKRGRERGERGEGREGRRFVDPILFCAHL